MDDPRPLIGLTMGDAAGVGPEVIARAWVDSPLLDLARPLVIGHSGVMARAIELIGAGEGLRVGVVRDPEEADPSPTLMPCLDAASADLLAVRPGQIDPRAGLGAYECLVRAIDLARAGRIDAITTLPLQKEALRAAGIHHPGHTEILAERCGVDRYAMMLYLGPETAAGPAGLGVLHVTLHMALREVFDHLTRESIHGTIVLADLALRPLTGGRPPRIGVAGLNPHAGEHGLFGDEEDSIIAPAVERARGEGRDVTGPIAADTLFARAIQGEFDAVVAMYHDQGHVALKTIGFHRAVNVTLGLPIVRTSVAHGTAFDIAWQGRADATSLVEAVRVAGSMARFISAGRGPDTSPS